MNLSTLQLGSTGLEVVTAQKTLTEAGFFLVADGNFGAQTKAATRLFQRSKGLRDDGIIGPQTWAKLLEAPAPAKPKGVPSIGGGLVQQIANAPSPKPAAAPVKPVPTAEESSVVAFKLDERSAKTIATLFPELRERAAKLVELAAKEDITIKIISGLRSYEEQDELYAQGRTKPGKVVTKAKGGQSWHNHGCAFDVGVFEGSSYLGESPHYKTVGELGESIGLEWGGRWKFKDDPHFQDANGKTLAQAQALHKKGKTVFDA